MGNIRIAALVLAGGWLALTATAQEQLVQVGKYGAHPTRILARYKKTATVQSGRVTLQSLGLAVHRQYTLVSGLVLLDNDRPLALAQPEPAEVQKKKLLARITALRDSGVFEYVDPDYAHYPTLVPNETRFADGSLWGLRNNGENGGVLGADISAVEAWDLTTGSTNVVVAIIDSGIRYTHRDLSDQMWRNPGEVPADGIDNDQNGYVDDVFGINSIVDSGDPFDDADHGTHVSGTIGASANNGWPHVGVAWNVRLMGLKFLRSAALGGYGLTSDAIQCLQYAVAQGAKVSNNSWGGGPFEQALLDATLAAAAAEHLFVAAAGNDGLDMDLDPGFPASYDSPNIISVAALDRADKLASFSNFGRFTVDLGAPGVEIYSSTSGSDNDYKVFEGTSMAAPHVTGVAALCYAHYPASTLQEMVARLLNTAVPVQALKNKSVTGGRLNALRALQADSDGVLEVGITPTPGSQLLQGSQTPFFIRVTDLLEITNASIANVMINGVADTNVNFTNDGQPPDAVSLDAIYSAIVPVPATATNLTLTFEVSAPGKNTTNVTAIYTLVGRPDNDNMVDAFKVPAGGGIVTGRNEFATLESKEPMHADVPSVTASVWWDWSPAKSGPAVVDVTGSTFDTVLGVYTGTNVARLTKIGAIDDYGTKKQGFVKIDVTAGVTYHIAVAGFDATAVGDVRLRVEPNGDGDIVPPSVFVASPGNGLIVTNSQLTVSGSAADPSPNASGVRDIFVQLNTDLASKANGTVSWTKIVQLTPGLNTIHVYGVDFADNSSEPVVVQVDFRSVEPLNDHFINATPLTENEGAATGDTTFATKEYLEPNHGGNEGGRSVWWTWTAPLDGRLNLSTDGSAFDTLLGVYTGSTVTNLTLIDGNDDAGEDMTFSRLALGVQAGVRYAIAVDGFAGKAGRARLVYNFSATNVYNLNISVVGNGTVTPVSGVYAGGTVVSLTATPDPDNEFVRWGGDIDSTRNPFSLKITNNTAVVATFGPVTPTEDFESGNLNKLPWITSGDAPWTVQSEERFKGTFAARSGTIGANQSSSLKLTTVTGGGAGTFDVRVSSEPVWDRLEFFVNDISQQLWSGEVDWRPFRFNVPAGTNTLEWVYSKDSFTDAGLDAAFIDNLNLPELSSDSNPAAAFITATLQGAGLRLQVQGVPGQTYRIEASTDLANWKAIATANAANGVLVITDDEAGQYTTRFYRAVAE